MIELPKKYDKHLFTAWQEVSLDFVQSLETGLLKFNMKAFGSMAVAPRGATGSQKAAR